MTAHLSRDAVDYPYAAIVHTAGMLRGEYYWPEGFTDVTPQPSAETITIHFSTFKSRAYAAAHILRTGAIKVIVQ